MGIFYIPKSGKKRPKKPCHCRVCGARILWAVDSYRKNIPIEYNPDLEYLYDGIAKVYFEPKIMKRHWSNCKMKGRVE